MQTHVNAPAKNHNAQKRYIISRCGSERIAEEEEEEIEKNMKEFSSAKSATFSRVRFRDKQVSLARRAKKTI